MLRKIKFVGQFSDPQVEMQMIEIVKTSQSLLDQVFLAQDSILNINEELEKKETKSGASLKALQAEDNAKSFATTKFEEATNYTDDLVASSLIEAKLYTDQVLENVFPPAGGGTLNRPSSPIAFQNYFDTDLGKPIWWNGTSWVDANGIVV